MSKDPKDSPGLRSGAAYWDYWALHHLVSSLGAMRRSRPRLWGFSPSSCQYKYHQMGRRQSGSAQEFSPTAVRGL